MNQKKVGNFLLVAGPVIFLLDLAFSTFILWHLPEFGSLALTITTVLTYILNPITAVSVSLAGLLVRLFAPTTETVVSPNQPISATAVPAAQKEYFLWKKAVTTGLIAWPFLLFFVYLGEMDIAGGGGDAASYAEANSWKLIISSILAFPIALACLLYARKQTNIRRAIFALRIPFLYLFVVIGIGLLL